MLHNDFDLLKNKSQYTLDIYHHLISTYEKIGPIKIYATKTMIVFANTDSFAYVIQLGKNFVDLVLPFNQPHNDNLGFRKIKQVSNTPQYNHHLRLYNQNDINEEVLAYMKLAYK